MQHVRNSMSRPILHLIPNAHLDPVWLWPWRDGAAETLTTMQSAVDRLGETADLRFVRSSANAWRWLQEQDPRLFAEARDLVVARRIEVVGGWIEQADCNLPSTEALARQALYGQGWFRTQLGTTATTGYNPDSFGHSAGLPQLLRQSGLTRYVCMRPTSDAPQSGLQVPVGLFWWEGLDGSRVLTWHLPSSYGQSPVQPPDELEASLRAAATTHRVPGLQHGAYFVGVGNHGGGPTRIQLERIARLQADPTFPVELRYATCDSFFAACEADPGFAGIPVYRGELGHCLRGCYAADARIKGDNRRAERALVRAETLTAIAGLSAPGEVHPGDPATLREAWWALLFNQFHDILAGTSVAQAATQIRDGFGAACHAADALAVRSLHRVARRIDTRGAPEGVVVAVNPFPWARRAVIQLDTFVSPHGVSPITHLRDAAGVCVPFQAAPADALFGPFLMPWAKLTAVVDLPPCGWRAFHAAHGEFTHAESAPAVVAAAAEGGLAQWATATGEPVLAAPLGLRVSADDGDTWGYQRVGYDAGTALTAEPTTVVADGPALRLVRQVLRHGASTVILELATWSGIAAVEIRVRANWQEPRQVLRLCVPTVLQPTRIRAKVAGGVLDRPTGRGEEVAQDWVALEGATAAGVPLAIGLVNDGAYSHACTPDGTLFVVIARNAAFAEHPPVREPADHPGPWLDQGWIERRFWLTATRGRCEDLDLSRLAESWQSPAEAMLDSAHPGTAAWSGSALSIAPAAVVMTALKPAEDGDGLILRVQETLGAATPVQVTLPALGIDWSGVLAPQQILSLRLTPGRVRRVDLLERPADEQ
jgi:alpha-mannosidase